MVASNSTQEAPPLHTTRQMLDDLDALMARMLSVPVGDSEAAPTPMTASKLSAKLTLLEPAIPPTSPPAAKPIANATPKSVPPPYETHVAPPVTRPGETYLAPPASIAPPPSSKALEPISDTVLPPSVLPRVTQLLAEVPDANPSALGLLYAPLWWINVAFDGCTHLLGRPGGFLRDAGGRLIIGLLGVVFSILAAGWYAKDWFGWTW